MKDRKTIKSKNGKVKATYSPKAVESLKKAHGIDLPARLKEFVEKESKRHNG
jgi:hypothetical protein